MQKSISFKGDGQGMTVYIDDEIDFLQVKEDLSRKINTKNRFFRSGLIRFHLGQRSLSIEEKDELLGLLHNQDERLVVEFLNTRTEKKSIDSSHDLSSTKSQCHIIEGTIRSGQKVEMNKSLLINGDVNPGAEIVSTGNIYILGSLRGLAHAGSSGDETAYVYALVFKPTQLRIARCIARSPEEETKNNGPEVARIMEGQIIVKPFNL